MRLPADCHMHSCHSGDSDTPMEHMILGGIRRGLTHMCFTEHNDFDFPDEPYKPAVNFLLNTEAYFRELVPCQEKYAGHIRILAGIELGMQPQSAAKNAALAAAYPFDFIIASSHVCLGGDPYYRTIFEGRQEEAVYRTYFESIPENIRLFDDFDVYGHLDYIVRYGPNGDLHYSYEKYREVRL